MCFTVTHLYLRNKTLFLGISWLWFSNVDVLGTLKFTLWTFCNVDIFQKMLHFYPTLKNGGAKHDFFGLLNVLVGVHERVENLLRHIGIRDSSFCEDVFRDLYYFWNLRFLKIRKICKFIYTVYINYVLIKIPHYQILYNVWHIKNVSNYMITYIPHYSTIKYYIYIVFFSREQSYSLSLWFFVLNKHRKITKKDCPPMFWRQCLTHYL